jgi:hypothetical protein
MNDNATIWEILPIAVIILILGWLAFLGYSAAFGAAP